MQYPSHGRVIFVYYNIYIHTWIKINMHLVSGMRILSKSWQSSKLFPWLLSHKLNDIFMAVLSHWNFDFELLGISITTICGSMADPYDRIIYHWNMFFRYTLTTSSELSISLQDGNHGKRGSRSVDFPPWWDTRQNWKIHPDWSEMHLYLYTIYPLVMCFICCSSPWCGLAHRNRW